MVDEPEAKLVILSPDSPHSAKDRFERGSGSAAEILNRGSAGRNYGNMMVFLAADKTRFVDLDKAVRSYMAWQSIEKEKVSLNLTPFQANQVEQRLTSSDQAVKGRIPETYVWLLVPGRSGRRLARRSRGRVAGVQASRAGVVSGAGVEEAEERRAADHQHGRRGPCDSKLIRCRCGAGTMSA